MSAFNPYAPPRDDAPVPVPRGPLPEGIRRYGLDPAKLRAYLDKAWRAVIVRLVVVLALYLALQTATGVLTIETLVVVVPFLGAYVVVASLIRRSRVRKNEPKVLHGYELLVSPRVLRRTAFGAVPAEILGPEVTSIVEGPDGLSIDARGAKRRLFVVRAVAGYEEVRDHVSHWRPVETRTGLAAWRRKWMHRFGERPRDGVADPSLQGELEAVRALAMPFDPRSVRRTWRRVLVLWLVLIALFLAIWQFLSPPPRPYRPPPRATPRLEPM